MDPFYADIEFYIRLCAVIFFGLCLGSFATALIYRIPNDIPWVLGNKKGDVAARSRCPSCKKTLRFLDLIPLFSWLCSMGKCRHCKCAVPIIYPVTEILTAIFVLAFYSVWGWNVTALPLYLSVPFLVAAVKIDWDHMILPDSINLSLLILAMGYVCLLWADTNDLGVVINHALAGVFLPAVFWVTSFALKRLRGREALGMGDIKFLAPAGLILGVAPIPGFMIVSGVLGLATALLKKSYQTGGAFPFGPALIISLYLHVFLTGLGFY